MTITRRETLGLGLAAVTSLGFGTVMPFAARAQAGRGDSYEVEGGTITIHPIAHASFVMTTPSMTIYCDPVGEASAYSAHPAPDPDHPRARRPLQGRDAGSPRRREHQARHQSGGLRHAVRRDEGEGDRHRQW